VRSTIEIDAPWDKGFPYGLGAEARCVVLPPAWRPSSRGIRVEKKAKTCLEWRLQSAYCHEGDDGGCRGGGLRRTAAAGWLVDVESRGRTVRQQKGP